MLESALPIVKGSEACGAASTLLDPSVKSKRRGRKAPVRDGGEADTEAKIGDARATGASTEETAAVVIECPIQQPQRFKSIGEERRLQIDIGNAQLEQRVLSESEHQLAPVEGRDIGENDDEGSGSNIQHKERQYTIGKICEKSADATVDHVESG